MDKLGLTSIKKCTGNELVVDVIFVHGLNGGSHTTWMSNKNKIETFWPQTLSAKIPNISIWTYGYTANKTTWVKESTPLPDSGLKFLEDLHVDGIGKNPIIFITHSMGGILIKHLLINGAGQGVERYKNIVQNVSGIAFLATPHSGSNFASFAKFAQILLRTSEQVNELSAHSSRLEQLHGFFLNFINKHDVKCRTYCETKEVRPKVLGKRVTKGLLVVDRSSSEPNIPNERAIPLECDHIDICKPKTNNDDIYKYIVSFLSDIVLDLKENLHEDNDIQNNDIINTAKNSNDLVSNGYRDLEKGKIERLIKEWLIDNKEDIVEYLIKKQSYDNDKYILNSIISNDLEWFLDTVYSHIDWMIEVFRMRDEEIPLSNFVNKQQKNIIKYDGYFKRFFELMYQEIDNGQYESNLRSHSDKASQILLQFINYLVHEYSH